MNDKEIGCTSSVEEWYKINVAIPFIDHIIADLETRFSPLTKTASSLLHFVPSMFNSGTDVDFTEVVDLFSCDMPSPELFDQEIGLWKQAFFHTPVSEKPATCASALKKCDSCIFPNVYTL